MPAKFVMLQGTMSHVGKTFLTAGLCRLFSEMGYRTAPFKPQNLSAASAVLPDGTEIGIGQAVQAKAAGAVISSRMNPLLLKVEPDGALAAYLHGKRLDEKQAAFYVTHRQELMREILKDFRWLQKQYDVICIEGAGSPAEPNLQQQDAANMGFAREVGAPVILVGDIERGGVFASLYGTLEFLREQDRRLVKGFIINKFSGERKHLDPAPKILEEKTGVPVLGAIPKLSITLEEEDVCFSKIVPDQYSTEQKRFEEIASILRVQLELPKIMEMMDMPSL